MYDFMIVYIDHPDYDWDEFVVNYNTELLTKDDLKNLISEMISTKEDINWLNEKLIVDYDSSIISKDNIKQYQYNSKNNTMYQVR